MNPNLEKLQPYPFQKLARLLEGQVPPAGLKPINLSVGEPGHATPPFIARALESHLESLSSYPATAGTLALRQSIAAWVCRRYGLNDISAERHVLPVNGSREALFAICQAAVDSEEPDAVVVMPNPFYQIYEGAAILAGARPVFLNLTAANGFSPRPELLADYAWRRAALVYVCTPHNPTGAVLDIDDWRRLFDLSSRYGFIIASDECYSEIYPDETNPPLGGLEASRLLGRSDYNRLVVFSSLSKRSNVPGLRSGFVAGDPQIIEKFLLYRTYHGSAMNPAVQFASAEAWSDEEHVVENRRLYREKFAAAREILGPCAGATSPAGGFYIWLPVPGPDRDFAADLYRRFNVTVLPGSFLSRQSHGLNPGEGFVRIALVADLAATREALERIKECLS